ncbi:hypothetical protein B7494_g5617 [Chlorociboria aeruginascens]|nr:hypothetical protein B7494_g5617 [Chlorociboria aeruginascens]
MLSLTTTFRRVLTRSLLNAMQEPKRGSAAKRHFRHRGKASNANITRNASALQASLPSRATTPPLTESIPLDTPRFVDLAKENLIHPVMLDTITEDLKFDHMMPVQAETLRYLLTDRGDCLAQAKTGTGKTMAFLLPAIQTLINNNRENQSGISLLVISPTRELAMQIAKEADKLLQRLPKYKVLFTIGGTNKDREEKKLLAGCDILIATPGRLYDHLSDDRVKDAFRNLDTLVLDEADRLLDMGFINVLKDIIKCLPNKEESNRQGMLFSATVSPQIEKVAHLVLSKNYKFISTIPEGEISTHERVAQQLIVVPSFSDVAAAMVGSIRSEMAMEGQDTFKAIVFAPTAALADFYGHILGSIPGLPTISILHSRVSQNKRTNATNAFRQAESGILVATDVVARGMDFPLVTNVFQVGVPADKESYIHRLGRTARAGAEGKGTFIITKDEQFFSTWTLKEIDFQPTEVDMSAESEVKEVATRMDNHAKIYQAWLGYYKNHLKGLKWNNVRLVQEANTFATEGLGAPEVPAIAKGIVRKMGLKEVKELNVVPDPPRVSHRGGGEGRSAGNGGKGSHVLTCIRYFAVKPSTNESSLFLIFNSPQRPLEMDYEPHEYKANDGATLKYIDTGALSLEDWMKDFLILIHGFTGSSAVWKRNIPALARKYRVIVPDLRGHGDSDKTKHGSHVSRLAMDLRELIVHVEKGNENGRQTAPDSAERPRWMGLGGSLGCSILWSYAELIGIEQFSKVVFVDQSPLQNSTLDGWDSRFCNRGMNNASALASLQTTLALNPEAAHKGTIDACLSYRSHPLETDSISESTREEDTSFFLSEAMKGDHEWYGKLMADHTSLDWRDSIHWNFGIRGQETEVLVVASSRSGCFPSAGPMKVVELINVPGRVVKAEAQRPARSSMDESAQQLIHESNRATPRSLITTMASMASMASSKFTISPDSSEAGTAESVEIMFPSPPSFSNINSASPNNPMEALRSSLLSGKFSDLIIIHGLHKWKAHKVVVCSQSSVLESQIKTVGDSEILDLSTHPYQTVVLLMDYLYTSTYTTPLAPPHLHLSAHVLVFVLSITLDIPGLSALSAAKYKYTLNHTSDLEVYFASVRQVYSCTSASNPGLRIPVAEAAVIEMRGVLDNVAVRRRFLQVLRENTEFLIDVLDGMSKEIGYHKEGKKEVDARALELCEECGPRPDGDGYEIFIDSIEREHTMYVSGRGFWLDFTLLTFGTLGMLIKWIDTSNITNAFVSGMKEDLDLYGNQYNYIVVAWTPSNFILTRVRVHIWIPFLEIGWTVFTFSLAGAKTYKQMLALRFIVGLFEAGYWPALYYILGSWYNKRELGKRNGILQSAVSIAPIFSGFLQAGIYNSLNGRAGLAGWRWLFVINGIISLPVAILAYFCLPDTPGTAKPNWLFSEREIELARERMSSIGRVPEGKPYSVKVILGYLTSWKTILFTLIFTMQPFGTAPFTSFVFWLKAHNKPGQPPVYSVAQINEYPTLGNAFTAVYSLLVVWISDGPLKGRRWPPIIFGNLVAIVIFVLLVVTPVFGPFSHRAPLYILSSIGGSAVPLTMAWMAELISDNAEQRAFTAAAMNTLQYTFSAWIPLVWFQQVHQPNVTPGNRAAAVVGGITVIVFIVIAVLAHREKKQKKRDGELPTSNSLDSSIPSLNDEDEKKLDLGVQTVEIQNV